MHYKCYLSLLTKALISTFGPWTASASSLFLWGCSAFTGITGFYFSSFNTFIWWWRLFGWPLNNSVLSIRPSNNITDPLRSLSDLVSPIYFNFLQFIQSCINFVHVKRILFSVQYRICETVETYVAKVQI